MQDPKTLLVVASLVVGGFFVATYTNNSSPLDGAISGIAVGTFTMHTAFFDGASNALLAAASSQFSPSTAPASLLGSTGGMSFAPMLPANSYCTQYLGITLTTSSGGATLTPPSTSLKGTVTMPGGGPASGAPVALYVDGSFYGATSASGTGTFEFASVPVATGTQVYASASKSGYCTIESAKLTTSGGSTSTPPAPPPVDPAKITLSVTLSGSVEAKNVSSGITLEGTVKITTALGKTFEKSFPVTTLAKEGGSAAMKADLSMLKADVGTGSNTIRVTVTAKATDYTGKAVSDTATVDKQATTDVNGSITLRIQPATLFASMTDRDGDTVTKERAFRVRTVAPGTI